MQPLPILDIENIFSRNPFPSIFPRQLFPAIHFPPTPSRHPFPANPFPPTLSRHTTAVLSRHFLLSTYKTPFRRRWISIAVWWW